MATKTLHLVAALAALALTSTVSEAGAVPDSTVFTLPQVLELHRASPELFPWCD